MALFKQKLKLMVTRGKISIKYSLNRFYLGWGTQRFSFWGNAKPPSHLQQANVPVVDYSTCAQKAGSRVHDQTMVCVGGAGKVACHGDR